MVEIMVVIGLIGILSAISYPSLSEMVQKYNFRAAAQGVFTVAMQARANSVRDDKRWRLHVTPPDTFALEEEILPETTPRTYTIVESIPLSNGITLISDTATSCGNATKNWNGDTISQGHSISFSGRGFGDAGSIFLEDSNNNICFAVSISGNGVVKLRRYNGATPYSNSNWLD